MEVVDDGLEQADDPVLDAGAVDLPELAEHHVDPLDGLLALQVLLEEEGEARGGHLRPGAVDLELALGATALPQRPELVEGGADEEEEGEEADDGAADGGRRERVDDAELGAELGDERVLPSPVGPRGRDREGRRRLDSGGGGGGLGREGGGGDRRRALGGKAGGGSGDGKASASSGKVEERVGRGGAASCGEGGRRYAGRGGQHRRPPPETPTQSTTPHYTGPDEVELRRFPPVTSSGVTFSFSPFFLSFFYWASHLSTYKQAHESSIKSNPALPYLVSLPILTL